MKTSTILFIIFGIIFFVGIGLLISPLGISEDYLASGNLKLTSSEWEQFKSECYDNQVDISSITFLDSGEIKLVEFENLRVDKNFHFGTLVKDDNKDTNSVALNIEIQFIIFGGFAFAICGGNLIDKYCQK